MIDRIHVFEKIYRKIQALSVKQHNKFIIIKPYGSRFKDEILSYLDRFAIEILSSVPICRWHRLSFFLYIKSEFALIDWQKRMEINSRFRQLEEDKATLLMLEEQLSFNILAQLKNEIRQQTGRIRKIQTLPGGKNIQLSLNSVHAPDESHLEYELKVLHYFLPTFLK